MTLNTTTPNGTTGLDNYLYNVVVGTTEANADLSGIGGANLRGDGTLTVTGSTSLFLDDPLQDTASGHLRIGFGAGSTGTLNWNSTGTLTASGYTRIGAGGTGTVNQNDGTIITSQLEGGSKYMAIGNVGGTGTYNLNNGFLEAGAIENILTGLPVRRNFRVANGAGSTGVFNLGDGMGGPGTATLNVFDEVSVGDNSATMGTLVLNSDGLLRINIPNFADPDIRLQIGVNSGTGLLQANGGEIDIPSRIDIGTNGGSGTFQVMGDTSTITARALLVGGSGNLTYDFASTGVSPIVLGGSAITSDDPSTGIVIESGNSMLNINNFSSYTSNSAVTLVDSLDSQAGVSGLFSNFSQGASVGTNSLGTEFFVNYFGGVDGNNLELTADTPASNPNGLVWNVGTANFDSGFFRSNGEFGPEATPTNPFGVPGTEDLFLGNDGVALLDNSTKSGGGTIRSLEIGTIRAGTRIAGANGNGTLTASGSASLTITDVDGTTGDNGDLTLGRGGTTGTLNWDSTGTLTVERRFRVGQGGTGIVNQTAGFITAGNTAGGGEYLAVGEGAGGVGTYNHSGGELRPGDGASVNTRFLRVGFGGGTGTYNLGDGSGATATITSENNIEIGRGAGSVGTFIIEADGVIAGDTANNDTSILVGFDNGTGTLIQNAGSVTVDLRVIVGALGAQSNGLYELNGGSFLNVGQGGTGAVRVGDNGGTGVIRIRNDATFSATVGDTVIGVFDNTDSEGTIDLIGSAATVEVGRLRTTVGNTATLRWEADSSGVTPIQVTATSLNTGGNRSRPGEAFQAAAVAALGLPGRSEGAVWLANLASIASIRY